MSFRQEPRRRWMSLVLGCSFLLAGMGIQNVSASGAVDTSAFPHYPSFLQMQDGRTSQLSDWSDPMLCGGCHPRQYEGWKSSMHANAFIDPVFQAEFAKGYKETDGAIKNLCAGCHTPIGVLTGTVEFDPSLGLHGGFTAPGVAAKGVTCDVCHSIVDTNALHTTTGNPGNASIILDPGNVKRATLRDSVSPFHGTEYSELHASSKLCANCHNIFHPDNNFPVEHTYDEWLSSPYAQNGIQCQDCHMVPVDIAIRVADEMKRPHYLENHGLGGFAAMGAAVQRELVHDHGFLGGNSLIASALGVPGAEQNRAQTIKRLQNVASLDVEIVPGRSANMLRVKVTNERAGHQLPTSLTFIRQVWLEVLVTDNEGRVLVESGQLVDNRVPDDAVMFTNRSVDAAGNPTIDPWNIAGFTQINTIPPKGHRYGDYAFTVPADSEQITVAVRLNYQSYHQDVADYLLGAGAIEVTPVVMQELTREFPTATLTRAAPDEAQAIASN